jgi:hypothetical protein
VVTGDFNGDGHLDVAASTGTQILVLLGTGSGALGAPVSTTTASISPLQTADFNGDGFPDLLVMVSNTEVEVLLGKGDGTFQIGTTSPLPENVQAMTVADVNGDGQPDFAVLTNAFYSPPYVSGQSGLWVFLNQGGAGFAAPLSSDPFPGLYNSTPSMTSGDLDGDGHLDLEAVFGGEVAVLLGNGDGTFAAPVDYPVPSQPQSLVVADVNGDQLLDVVTTNRDVDVSVLLGRGDGSLEPGLDFEAAAQVTGVATLGHDGHTELAVTDGARGLVDVLPLTCP